MIDHVSRDQRPYSPWLTFFVVLAIGLLTPAGHLFSPDEEVMFRVTETMATEGRTHVKPIDAGGGNSFASRRGLNGNEYAQYGLGNSIAALPFYGLGHALTWVIDEPTGRKWFDFKTTSYVPEGPEKGHDLIKRFAVSFTGIFIAAATAALISVMVAGFSARLAMGRQVPFITGVAYMIGTMAWPHSRTFFSEPLATLLVLLAFHLAAGSDTGLTRKRALLSGLAFAGAMATRLDTAFVFPGWLVYLLTLLPGTARGEGPIAFLKSRKAGESFGRLILAAIPIVVFLAWQMLHNYLRFGSPLESAYADQTEGINFSTPVVAGLHGFLMSPGKSIFLFSPAVILALAGWGRFAKAYRGLAWGLAIAVFCKVMVHATWQNWAGGWCWGPRHIFMVHALLLPAAAFFLASPGLLRRLITSVVLTIGIGVQLLGTSQSFIDFFIIYFRTPHTPPSAYVVYSPEDSLLALYRVETQMADGTIRVIPPAAMPAPLQDSIYMPYNTQWPRYLEMWNEGYTDNLWLRLLLRSADREQPVL